MDNAPRAESWSTGANPEAHSLYRPTNGSKERGAYEGHVAESSLYTKATLDPALTGAMLAGTAVALRVLWRARK